MFLSIGYSACHWCHVMAHESFEDPAVARDLNASFVSIKVDREERPDVDAVYMEAVQSITGSGGWPMSVFLTPDQRPFFGGTYFPPEDRPGMPSFRTVLTAIDDIWENRRSEVDAQASELAEAVASRSVVEQAGVAPPAEVSPDLLTPAIEELARRFDPQWGGFGRAPKFPQPTLVDLLLYHSLRRPGTPAGDRSGAMAALTLDAMAAGGIHDHLGGGFARYATDDQWLVPHFEKMLYDQAGLVRAFLHGWQVTGRADYLRVVEGIVDYVNRDLTIEAGGVCSAEDADSEGVEGRFYLWSPALVEAAVATTDDPKGVADAVNQWFAITEAGNFEGLTILRRPVGAPLLGPETVERGRHLLFEARSSRVRPGLDDKVLTEWNAMYGSALAEAAAATANPAWGGAAIAIGEFLWLHLRGDEGRWRRSWRSSGGSRHLAFAADYAWLVDFFTRLAELTGQSTWTVRAVEAADALIDLFGDQEGGGLFTTGRDGEALIVRTKDVFDGATPSANAVAALALARLGALTGTERYTAAAGGVVDMLGSLLARHPTAFPHTLLTAVHLAEGWTQVVIAGDRPDLLATVHGRWLPDAVVAWGQPTASPLWEDREIGRAYVCQHFTCLLPTDDPATLAAQLTSSTVSSSPPEGNR